jgi:hypothetical protein
VCLYTERETEGGNVVKVCTAWEGRAGASTNAFLSAQRKGVVEEYMQGGVFPMVGESAYTGHLTYLIPPNTRPSNQWRTYVLMVL